MLVEAAVARIEMPTKDWRRIELITRNADEIALVIYPTYKGRKEMSPKDLAAQWARHNFRELLATAVVMVEESQASATSIVYVLLAGSGAVIQAMDAVLSDEKLFKRIYQKRRFSDVSALCKYILPAEEPQETGDDMTSEWAVDGELIKDFNNLLVNCSKITDLKSVLA